ncbi:MAG: IS1595 family transposase [Flavobacteriales bacterium]|nr:IS1595 family transposase [Flavobacteriales bacterium]
MDAQSFFQQFGTEEQCVAHLKALRESKGLRCKKCNSERQSWLSTRLQWECMACKFRTGIRSGTLFQHSHVPIHKWYHAIYFMTETKKSISSLELQRKLGMTRIATVWYLQQRIRIMMGGADNQAVRLSGEIELDDAFITAVNPKSKGKKDNEDPPKRGRGSQRKHPVVVMVESESNNSNKGKCGNLKMIATESINTPAINEIRNTVLKNVHTARTDAHPAYRQLGNRLNHIFQVTEGEQAGKLLPWVHIAISNIKRLLNGINHFISARYLQYYLDEFVFKFNNRFSSSKFDNLLGHVTKPILY